MGAAGYRLIPIEDAPPQAFAVTEEGYGYVELLASIEQGIGSIPDALLWLSLVQQGYTPDEARILLHRSHDWLAAVLAACAAAVEG